MGTALRKLNKEIKGIGEKGKSTDSLLDELKNYHRIAIRSNSVDLSGMRSAIHASFFHCISSKESNLYHHCPDRPDSWCSYKREKANNTKFYKPGPALPYARLSTDDLLRKSLDCKTKTKTSL